MELIVAIASIVGIVGMLGLSHKNLNQKISKLEEKSQMYRSETQIRQIIADRDEILAVQLRLLAKEMQDIKEELKKLNRTHK